MIDLNKSKNATKYASILNDNLHKSWILVFHENSFKNISQTIDSKSISEVLNFLGKKNKRKCILIDNFFYNETETKNKLFFIIPYNGRPSKIDPELCGMFIRPSKQTPSSTILKVPLFTSFNYFNDPLNYVPENNLKVTLFSIWNNEEICNDFSTIINYSVSPIKNDSFSPLLLKSINTFGKKLLEITRKLIYSLPNLKNAENDSVLKLYLEFLEQFFLLQVRLFKYKSLLKQTKNFYTEDSGKKLISAKKKLTNSQRILESFLFPVIYSDLELLQKVENLNLIYSGFKK